MVSLDTPTSSIDVPLHTRKYVDTFLLIVSFLLSSSHETFVKEDHWFFGGAIVVRIVRYIPTIPSNSSLKGIYTMIQLLLLLQYSANMLHFRKSVTHDLF